MNAEVVKAAAHWYVALRSDPADAGVRRDFEAWHAHHDDHRRAWAQVEAWQSRMSTHRAALPGALGSETFGAAERLARGGRRAGLKSLLFAGLLGGGAWSAWREAPQWLAAHRTGTGEQREVHLEDGSRLVLNTRTAVDVRFDAAERCVQLHQGELLVETAIDLRGFGGGSRPFRVQTEHGDALALGTRFSVRLLGSATRVTVLERAVELRPAHADARRRLVAGEQGEYTAEGIGPTQPADDRDAAWVRGMLIATDWTLGHFVDELARYRPGLLGCADNAAGLRISGAFPVRDTDLALKAVMRALPVRLEQRTRFWSRLVLA